ncbi:MAG: NADAR family protein [Lachnospiraceae bacterium]|nr:NADAR family protein [Lachnospiraceae bacterium]
MAIRKVIARFDGKYEFLSNFYNTDVKMLVNGKPRTFKNSEAAFQAIKCANDSDVEQFTTMAPGPAKRLGKKVLMRSDWETVKDGVMHDVLVAKFTQNKELAEKLIETGDAILIEGNNWHDNYWGVCICDDCAENKDQSNSNHLGDALMMVREELKSGVIKVND